MRQYLVRRLLLMIPTLWLTSVIIFVLIRCVPGDMVDLLADQRGGSFAMDAGKIRERLGLNKPIHIQYLHWLGEMARGNFGESMWSRRGVIEEMVRRFPVTLELAVLTLILSTLWGLLVGVIAAAHQDSVADYVFRSIAIAGLSIPYFWS